MVGGGADPGGGAEVITAVVSDLHLGDTASLLGTPHPRRRLIDALATADRVVLLGDVLSLRGGPVDQVLERARPFFADLGEALQGRELAIVPGNHDHQLVAPLLERRRLEGAAGPLGLEWRVEPGATGPAGAIAAWLEGIEVTVAYPGLRLRPDVYATHGHYLDCHMTVPRIECVGAALMQATTGRVPERDAHPDDYEGVLAPMYALAHSRAQAPGRNGGAALRMRVTSEPWRWLKDGGGGRRGPRRVLAGGLAYGVLAIANRLGLDRFRADLSIAELDRAGVRAMAEVVSRLDVDADHVLFGHTHRAGPRDGDGDGWEVAGGPRLHNTGSWVYSPGLIGDAGPGSPYWPGTCAFVGPSGPPELRGLLDELRMDP
jgi:predicted phosphodiesterase